MPTITLTGNNGNPYVADTGKRTTDATTIYSGFTSVSSTGSAHYQIRRRDRSPWVMDGTSTLNVYASNAASELVQSVSLTSLAIVLPERQWFEVRVRNGTGAWSAWVAFKTRDKTYKLPDAVTELRVTQAASSTGETVTVTNVGKATETTSSTGTRVVNTDNGANDVTSVVATSRGATITRRTRVVATATGARVDNT